MGMLSDEERASVSPARLIDSPTPVPTQVVSSDEFMPVPQTERQKKVEARMNALADEYGRKNGLSRRNEAKSRCLPRDWILPVNTGVSPLRRRTSMTAPAPRPNLQYFR